MATRHLILTEIKNQSIMSGSNTNQWHYGDNFLQQNHRQNHIETYSNNDNMQSEVPFYSKSMLNRLNSLATGSYKYNPYIINQVNRLGNNNSISRIKIFTGFSENNHLIMNT